MNINKLSLYLLIMLLYLGLSKSFSPSEFGISYVLNNQSLAKIVKGYPVSVILVDIHSTGFIIKTYYHKYKLIYGYHSIEEVIVRTSSQFNEKHLKNIGMSIFRRSEKNLNEDFTPMPPGSLFIGDRTYGEWVLHDSGDKIWRFYRPYRFIPESLGWGNFLPNKEFGMYIQNHIALKKAFYGKNNEFGTDGKITKEVYEEYFSRKKPQKLNIKKVIGDYFKENFKDKLK